MDKAKLPQPKPKASGASAASNMAVAASRKSTSSVALSCVANQMLKSLGLEDIDPEHVFEIQNKEGAGAFGRVFRAFYKSDPSKLAALKVIPVALEAGQRGEDIENVRKEIQFLRECDHPNVVAFYGAYYKDGALWVAMEYCGGGSVGDVSRHRRLKEHEIAVIMRGALYGLAYLHSKKKIHRDIKGGNILLTSGGQVKIADFGVSAQLRDTMSRRGTFVGTPYWMSPEMIQDSDYDYKSDIWSLGITAIELADQKPPLFDEHPMRVLIQIPRNPSPQLKNPSSWSVEFSQFLQFCLQKDPVERPTALECLEHVFIRGVEHIERVYSSIGRQEQVEKSLVVLSAPEIPPPPVIVEAGVADKAAAGSTGVAAAHNLTVASNAAAKESEGEVLDAMKLKPDGEELKGDCGDGGDIAEDISRLDEDDGSESASDSEDDAGDQKPSTVSQNDKADDRGLHSKADNSGGSEDDNADDGASSDSDSSGTAEEIFNFRQPTPLGLMVSEDELLQLSVSDSAELPSHVKNQTIIPPATAPSGSHSLGTDAPVEHTESVPAFPTGSQPPTEFKLLLPVASSSPLRKSAKNKVLGEQFFVSSTPKPHAVKSLSQPESKQHQHVSSLKQQSVVTTMPKQLSGVLSSWQNPLSDVQASSNARVNVLLSSISSLSLLSSSSTRLFTKLLQEEVENQKMDQDLQRSSINSSSRYATPPRNSVIRGDDLSHRRSLLSAASASASVSTVAPNSPAPQNHQFSRASISTSSHLIGDPFRVAHDICVKFNSVDARFEGAPASEEWAVLHQQFGIPLAQMRCRSSNSGGQVPALLHMLRRELLKRDGLTTKYIYRASPEQNEVQSVKKAINSGSVEHSCVSDPHVYASLIKQWLRELPSLLLSKLNIDDFTSKSDDVTQVLSKLSPKERAVLEWVLDHMLEVVEKSAVNKMTAQSLAIVMAPNLFNCESVSKTLAGASSAVSSVAESLCALLTWRQTDMGGGGGSTSNLNRSLSFAARRSVVGEPQTSDAPIQGTGSVRSRTSSVGSLMPIEPRSLESVDEQSHLFSDTGQSLEELIKLAADSVWNELGAQGIDSVGMLLTDKHVLNQRFEKYQRSILELIARFSKRNEDRDWAGAVRMKLENESSVQNVAIPSSLGGVKRWVKAALSVDDFLHQLRSEKNIREKLELFRKRFPVDCGMKSSSSSDGGARMLDPDKTYDLFHQIFLASLDETDLTTRGCREPAEKDGEHAGQGADSDLREGALRLLRFNTNADSQSELVLRAEEIAKCGAREPTIGNLLAGLSQSSSFSHLHLEESQEQLANMVQSTLKVHQLLQY